MDRLMKILSTLLCMCSGVMLMAILANVLICDRFRISGESMWPEYASGEAVWVNKLIMGARIYTCYDFDAPELECFRMPGLGRLKAGDVAVFNAPYGRGQQKIEFRINYVYAKRCLGCPGDTIGVADCRPYNTRVAGIIGYESSQKLLRHTPDSLIPPHARAAYPYSSDFDWTIRNLGPLVVPFEGMKVVLDRKAARLYAHVIEYETGYKPEWKESVCYIGDKVCSEYEFVEDYYYFVGDNVLDSKDSRYFGFVPEDFIVGKVVSHT